MRGELRCRRAAGERLYGRSHHRESESDAVRSCIFSPELLCTACSQFVTEHNRCFPVRTFATCATVTLRLALAWDSWMPRAPPQPCASGGGQDFVQSLATMAGAGEPTMRAGTWETFAASPASARFALQAFRALNLTSAPLLLGLAVHLYSADCNMDDKSFCNSDGDFLIARHCPWRFPLSLLAGRL